MGEEIAGHAGSLDFQLRRYDDNEIYACFRDSMWGGQAESHLRPEQAQELAHALAFVGAFPPPQPDTFDDALADDAPYVQASYDRDVIIDPGAHGEGVTVVVADTSHGRALSASLGGENALLLLQRVIDAYAQSVGLDAAEVRVLRKLKAEALRLSRERRREQHERPSAAITR
jgi:hypothetical protein